MAMKVDKKKLLEAIKSGKTEMFEGTGYGGVNTIRGQEVQFTLFQHAKNFKLTDFVYEGQLEEASKGFKLIREELKRLNCLNWAEDE